MAATIQYKRGTKAQYLALATKNDNALYFCTDTRELFKGEDLYTDGVRTVADKDALPEFASAAQGTLYVCEDSGNGFVLNADRDAWVQVIHGIDTDVLEYNTDGLLTVKAEAISFDDTKVKILEAKVEALEGALEYKGTVATKDDLPTASSDPAPSEGDVYYVTDEDKKYRYDPANTDDGPWVEYTPTTPSLDEIYAAICWEDI